MRDATTKMGTFRRVLVQSQSDRLWMPAELGDTKPEVVTNHILLLPVDLPHSRETRGVLDAVWDAQQINHVALCGMELPGERVVSMPAYEPIDCEVCRGTARVLADNLLAAISEGAS